MKYSMALRTALTGIWSMDTPFQSWARIRIDSEAMGANFSAGVGPKSGINGVPAAAITLSKGQHS